jgi:hypothetical protein
MDQTINIGTRPLHLEAGDSKVVKNVGRCTHHNMGVIKEEGKQDYSLILLKCNEIVQPVQQIYSRY